MITSDEILGNDVIDPRGVIIGVVTKLHMSRDSKELLGITVDRGLIKPELFVGISHVEHFGISVVRLNKIPFDIYIGLKVFTEDGRFLGKVREIKTSGKNLRLLRVGRFMSPKKNLKEVTVDKIKEIGAGIIIRS